MTSGDTYTGSSRPQQAIYRSTDGIIWIRYTDADTFAWNEDDKDLSIMKVGPKIILWSKNQLAISEGGSDFSFFTIGPENSEVKQIIFSPITGDYTAVGYYIMAHSARYAGTPAVYTEGDTIQYMRIS
tara:strand:- start:208 stop:591 length:384 start_codon:yes stop_codon:yes gene_type:complete